MKFLIVLLMIATVQSKAATKMGPEAVEMFSVLTNRQVVDCLERADVKMVNISIEKSVARCPGCNTYVITGNKRNIDTPTVEKTKSQSKEKLFQELSIIGYRLILVTFKSHKNN